jgi:CubicO group peptidase (beta-lactamase class C family)
MTDRRELLAMVGALALTPRAFAQSSPPSAQNLAVLPPITVDADVLARLPGMLKEQFPATLGLCITQRDRILLDYRREGASKDDLFRVYSITKSVLAMLVGIAHDRRFIASLDRSIASYFPEIDLSAADPRARDVTIRHVLTMTAGWNTAGNTGIQPPPVTTSGFFRPFHANPGETFIYDNNASNILGILLARAVGQPLDVFAEEVLFKPLGITNYAWRRSPDGHLATSGGLSLSIDSIVRIGRLAMHRGDWHGRRILGKAFADEMFTRRTAVNAQEGLDYGYMWFAQRTPDEKHEGFIAQGFGGQVLSIVPGLDLIVATTTEPGEKANTRFIRSAILPAARG